MINDLKILVTVHLIFFTPDNETFKELDRAVRENLEQSCGFFFDFLHILSFLILSGLVLLLLLLFS